MSSPVSHLPVPALEQTLAQYLDAVAPLLGDAEYARTTGVVVEFARGDGPACQAELERFAEQENAEGRSWLSNAWFSAYLTGRSPLTLSTSVGFELNWPPVAGDGWTLAADVLHRLAAAHLAYVRGEIEQAYTPRGTPLCMQQWHYLAGGLRHPLPDEDVFVPGSDDPANREVAVLWRGRMFALRVTDESGRLLSLPAIEAALRGLPPEPASGSGFADVSYLGSEHAAGLLGELLELPANRSTYERLTDALFGFTIGEDAADVDTQVRQLSFELGRAWAYKPVTYSVSLPDRFVGMHVEHSMMDGGTLKSSVALGRSVVPDATPAPPAWVEELAWQIDADLLGRIDAQSRHYAAAAADYRVRTLPVRTLPQAEMPNRFSHDAGQQWVLLYAQLATYGRLRSTYEAVDMREYQAGRTECLRPNTVEAVALVTSLMAGDATSDQLQTAAAAHRERVIACKTGQSIDRHLLGLWLSAQRLGLTPEIFTDVAYGRLTRDFLSTTSLGDQTDIVRYGFAPSIAEGMGVDYTALDGAYEFTLSYREDHVERMDDFIANLHAGAAALFGLIASAR